MGWRQSASNTRRTLKKIKRKIKTGKKRGYKKNKMKTKQQHVMLELGENHLLYELSRISNIITIQVEHQFDNPRLMREDGEINAKIRKGTHFTFFNFKVNELTCIEGIATKIYIMDGNKKYHLTSGLLDMNKNYNNIREVMYDDIYVYYFRNTASLNGYLVFQKKIRAHFESEKYEQLVESVYQNVKQKPVDKVVFYEKYGSKYEESASILFKQVAHHSNVYFVLDSTSPQYYQLKMKYGEKIISPEEQRFLEVIFTAKYYIGTEIPFHMITLRSPYKRLREDMMNHQKHRFIFLQHGVMYALSMKPASRNSFKKNGIHQPFKVIVSSTKEANHLKKYGHYKNEDIWKTGLATFDNKQISPQANKLTIMLTWRPWDEQLNHLEDTTYYQALMSIIKNITNKQNLQVILHPKVLEKMDTSNPLYKYRYVGHINDALSETKVLITDYSSISFDAFNRGANIIFWWQQKDECLKKYKNHLMLNEKNIFGDIVYDNEMLDYTINENYNRAQSKVYLSRFHKIVEFSDNQNTERILMHLYQLDMFQNNIKDIDASDLQVKLKQLGIDKNSYKKYLKVCEINGKLSATEYQQLMKSDQHYLIKSTIGKLNLADTLQVKNSIKREMYEVISNYTDLQ